ncbi:TonB system transport protein ExbD [Gilvimarinus agarilyticus]|uniref:TonB system transport protein ExbD n=1 Tax=Gilvimarinus sp. 2_MG-2023 TaxID=3062666 RepID=UPI001C09A0E7|nr:TonB system transport protein ExbD [Gilvimarinus sp. 2_MG-2023]MBU2887439.1 TonB system transport protein ExbD [Gilvimarinus agarilyticus]MDO6572098.1 TonB system transport protein ExbD [Gilvimarinus sp. 2_MG-2023]
MAFGKMTDSELQENHEINVTPFIDVVLVLLIVFMVAAPLATVNIPVDLPEVSSQSTPDADDSIYLTLNENLTLILGEKPVAQDELATALSGLIQDRKGERIFLRADRSVGYGELMDLMNKLRGLGYNQIALVGEQGG